MEPGSPLLALRLGGQSHALEPGRDYLLGTAEDCDLRIVGAEPHHARLVVTGERVIVLDLTEGEHPGLLYNEERAAQARLQPGDRLGVGDEIAVVAVDDGSATIVPIPALRQAAAERRIERVRVAAAALRHNEQSFNDLMATELRRAPWLMMSLAVHLLALLLFWWFTPAPEVGGQSVALLGFDVKAGAPEGNGHPAVPEVTTEQDEDEVLDDPELETQEQPAPELEGPPVEPTLQSNPKLASRKRPSSLGRGRNIVRDEGSVGTGSFEKQVAELQESGLEIVFVFDSTGSMTRTILDTKSTIVQMLDVLRTLVPDARVGLVTYRDRSKREDYVVRQVPLDIDYWRASNFVQFVTAEGGGDRPEDVRAGLQAAFSQDWRRGARRVVVLAGDAPAHESDVKAMLKEVKAFTSDAQSYVHTLITSPERAGEDTEDHFTRIAKAGRGTCEPLENRERVLQRVLTLAFGREFDRDLEQVVQNVEAERGRVDVQSLHLVRAGGRALRDALRQRPVPTTLFNALTRRPRADTAEVLIDLLGDSHTPEHTRHAAAAALQRMLQLPVPPIDPQTGEPPSQRRLATLRRVAADLPR